MSYSINQTMNLNNISPTPHISVIKRLRILHRLLYIHRGSRRKFVYSQTLSGQQRELSLLKHVIRTLSPTGKVARASPWQHLAGSRLEKMEWIAAYHSQYKDLLLNQASKWNCLMPNHWQTNLTSYVTISVKSVWIFCASQRSGTNQIDFVL